MLRLPSNVACAIPRTCASAWAWDRSTSARRRGATGAAFAVLLLTLLGATGEALGYDRFLKSGTTMRQTHSLFRRGCMLYELIPTMPEPRLLLLVQKFANLLANLPVFAQTFGAVCK